MYQKEDSHKPRSQAVSEGEGKEGYVIKLRLCFLSELPVEGAAAANSLFVIFLQVNKGTVLGNTSIDHVYTNSKNISILSYYTA